MTGAVASAGLDATSATFASGVATTMGEAVTRVSTAPTSASMRAIPNPMPTFFKNCTFVPFVRIVLVPSFIHVFFLLLCFSGRCGRLHTTSKN